VHAAELGDFLGSALTRFRETGPPAPLPWPDNCPFVVYYGEVSADRDGPVELGRPVDADPGTAARAAGAVSGATVRREAAHEEVYLRLPRSDAGSRLLEGYATLVRRAAAGAGRRAAPGVIADWRTVGADEPAFDLAVPLR
jgi:hypothetical protein